MNVFSRSLSPASATVVVLTAMVGYGFNPLFARWIYAFGLSPEISVVYRYGLPALLMLPFVTSIRNQTRESLMAFCGGLSMGLGALGYFKALSVLPVSVCVLIFFTYPLFTIIFGRIFFGVRIQVPHMISAFLILCGCALTLGPSKDVTGELWTAVAWCFLAPVGVTSIILLFSLKLKTMNPLSSTAFMLLGNTVIGLQALFWLDGFSWVPDNPQAYWPLIGTGLITALIPHLLFIWASPVAGPAKTAICGSAEFLTSLFSGWFILHEPILWNEISAAILILVALLISVRLSKVTPEKGLKP